MLWSLLKFIFFLGAIAALAFGAGWLLEAEGGLRIAFGAQEFNLTPLRAVIALLVLIVVIWLLLKLASFLVAVLRFLNGDETAISRYFNRNRERKGFEALSDGMMALASGESRLAMSKAAKAEKYLRRPELTNLLTAQAAEQAGDTKKANEVYKRLLADDRTRFVGVRGIMKQKLTEGDTETAQKLAQKAFALKPKHEETQDILLRLQADSGDWTGARSTLGAKLKAGFLPRDVHKRRDAVLALQQARVVLAEDSSIEAREAAIEANRLSPDLIPAAVLAAQSYIAQAKPKLAARVLKKAWESQPHPDLAAAFAAIAPEETPAERIKRFAPLTKLNADHPETKMLRAELHLADEDFEAAGEALGDLAERDPTARTLAILAAVERGQGAADSVVRGILAKALSASRGPQWVCDKCEHVHGHWAPVCVCCGGFDTLSWRVPKAGDTPVSSGADMVPLIVGAEPVQDEPVAISPDATEVTAEAEEEEDLLAALGGEEEPFVPPVPDAEIIDPEPRDGEK